MIKISNLIKIVLLTLIFSICTNLVAAQPTEQPQTEKKQPSARAQALAEKRELFQQQAETSIPEVEAEYLKYVTYINSGHTPDDANVNAGLKFIARTRKFLPVYSKQHKSGIYYALSAWVYYFDNKPDKAIKQVTSGLKDARNNTEIIKTNLALSLLYKDFVEASKTLAYAAEKKESADEKISSEQPAVLSSTVPGSELNLDINSVPANLLGKEFDFRPAHSKDVLCLLLWKLDPNELDRFAPPPPPKPSQPNEPNAPAVEPPPAEPAPNESANEPKPEFTEFSKLYKQFEKNPKAVFMGINLNDPSKIVNIENWMAKNPQSWQIVAPSAQIQQSITALLGSSPKKPTLLITGPDSKIRYVGDVNSFLPNMIIKHILATPQEFAEPNEANEPNKPAEANEPNQAPAAQQSIEFLKPSPNEPNIIASRQSAPSPNQPKQTQQSPQTINTQTDDTFTEADYEAQKDLEYARTLFKIANRMQYRSYAKPIELCRKVIKNYPNKKYADEARVLLRQVPERFRANYNITDEELGL